MKKIHLICILTLCTLIVSCGSSSIVGKWQDSKSGRMMEYTSDGKIKLYEKTGEPTGHEFPYTTEGAGKLTMNDPTSVRKCFYKIEGNKMSMTCNSGAGEEFPAGFSNANPPQITLERK